MWGIYSIGLSIKHETPKQFHIDSGLVLQTLADEVLISDKLFIVDCRTPKEYNKAHLTNAFFLDPSLLQNDSDSFDSTVEVLMEARKMRMVKKNLAKDRVCFIADKNSQEGLNLVLSYFLTKKVDRITYVNGGFEAIVKYIQIQDFDLEDWLAGQNLEFWEIKENPEDIFNQAEKVASKISNSFTSGWGKSMSGWGSSWGSTTGTVTSVTAGLSSLSSKLQETTSHLSKEVSNFSQSEAVKNLKKDFISGVNHFTEDVTTNFSDLKAIFAMDISGEYRAKLNQIDMISIGEYQVLDTLLVELNTSEILTFEGVHIYDKDLKLKCLVAISEKDTKFYLIHLGLRNKETASNLNTGEKEQIKIGRVFDKRELSTLMKITSRKAIPELLTFKFGSHDSLKPEMLKVQKSIDEEKNNSEPAAADEITPKDQGIYDFDCILKVFMKCDAGDAARRIKGCLQEVYNTQKKTEEKIEA